MNTRLDVSSSQQSIRPKTFDIEPRAAAIVETFHNVVDVQERIYVQRNSDKKALLDDKITILRQRMTQPRYITSIQEEAMLLNKTNDGYTEREYSIVNDRTHFYTREVSATLVNLFNLPNQLDEIITKRELCQLITSIDLIRISPYIFESSRYYLDWMKNDFKTKLLAPSINLLVEKIGLVAAVEPRDFSIRRLWREEALQGLSTGRLFGAYELAVGAHKASKEEFFERSDHVIENSYFSSAWTKTCFEQPNNEDFQMIDGQAEHALRAANISYIFFLRLHADSKQNTNTRVQSFGPVVYT